ncbi:hypothetical protein ZIOFF_015290 [Zingiber officinale]|uniref:phenylalanine--tRNA ligase n=1 Tax=Zingiber officinale TaxID=94328 RepID=A0A8J5HUA6_ZINOF|nr:hypothetical protein ZIOFF_015290 [Zingiber officinale]
MNLGGLPPTHVAVAPSPMPTVNVGRDRLFAALGETYTQEEFEELCFKFGIELDDVTTEKAIIRKERHLEEEQEVGDEDEEVIYKIDVAANRYDLLCLEGIARALRIFNEKEASPLYTVTNVSPESIFKMHVKPETSLIRPFVVCAVLRGVAFDEARYNSFIDLQDKLHQNICRRRTLVAIGTHDLDTIQGPFSYEALPPQEINFVPLKQVKIFRADELLEYYKSDMKLKKFLHIIENSPVYPVIYDRNSSGGAGTVLSLPPIINGTHSAISLKTRNVFIECTATDLTKAKIVLNTMVTMFSEYCTNKFEVEPVEVVYSDGKSMICPDLSVTRMEVPLSEIIDPIGISLDASEDVAIAYGYNNIPKSKPKCMTTGGRQPLNRFSDKVRAEVGHHGYFVCSLEYVSLLLNSTCYAKKRCFPLKYHCMKTCMVFILCVSQFGLAGGILAAVMVDVVWFVLAMCFSFIRPADEVARAGYMEVLTWVLCSLEENFSMLRRKDDGDKAVIIANPRSADFEVS